MSEIRKVPHSASQAPRTGTVLQTAIVGIPPMLRRFQGFIKDMAKKFSRHCEKDRSAEFEQAVIEEFKNV